MCIDFRRRMGEEKESGPVLKQPELPENEPESIIKKFGSKKSKNNSY